MVDESQPERLDQVVQREIKTEGFLEYYRNLIDSCQNPEKFLCAETQQNQQTEKDPRFSTLAKEKLFGYDILIGKEKPEDEFIEE